MKGINHIKQGEIEITEIRPDYKGITSVLNSFVEIYKVCGDKKAIDSILEKVACTPFLIKILDEKKKNNEN